MARHPYTSVSFGEELNPPVEKKGSSWIHPHSHGCNTKTFKKRRRRDTRPTSVVSPVKRNADYLNKKLKNGLQKILRETTRKSWKWDRESILTSMQAYVKFRSCKSFRFFGKNINFLNTKTGYTLGRWIPRLKNFCNQRVKIHNVRESGIIHRSCKQRKILADIFEICNWY